MIVDLSVIIPVYNAGALIDRCLDSVLSQGGGYGVEVICVDDGSTDNSVELIERRADERVRLLRQANAGPAAARNRGMAVAKGRYMAYLDADDYWMLGFVEQTVGFLDAHPECIAVNVAQRHITTQGDSVRPQIAGYGEALVIDDFWTFWVEHNHICTGSITMRTEVAREIGGQREDLRICEDLEFWAMLGTRGRLAFIPQVLFVSDGGRVTETIGWVEKHRRRWESATTVEEWERRLPAISAVGYKKRRGQIARNLAYSMIMSDRAALAREEIRKYGADFPRDNMSRLLRLGASCSLLWNLVWRMLHYREYHR